MIIRCDNCDKKFEVNQSLIPEKGRFIQCGSCNHKWFYSPNPENIIQKLSNEVNTPQTTVDHGNEKTKIPEIKDKFKKNDKITINKSGQNTAIDLGLRKILSYLFVGVISFIAIIIILDTFKSPLSNFFPDLELVLYNLFESIKDIFLFIKDLSV